MSILRRFGIRHAVVVVIATGGIAAMAAALPQPQWPPQPPPPTDTCGYCYNVDIANNTPSAANDLHVTLQGPSQICGHYLGSSNPFGMPTKSINGNTISLHYASSTRWVQPGEIAHIGFCVDSPVSGMVPGNYNRLPPFYWTRDRFRIGDIVAVGHAWQVAHADFGISPVVTLINTTPGDIHIRQIDWAVVSEAIPLNDLMWTGLEHALEWQPLQEGTLLRGGTSEAPGFLQAPIPAVFEPGDPRHIVFRFWAEDPANPRNMNRGLGQASIATLAAQER